MDLLEGIRTRRSVRKFKKLPVEFHKICQIAEAATQAPSAGNLQDFRIIAVTKQPLKESIAKLCMNQMWMADAAVYLIVYSCFTKTQRFYGVRGERLYSIQSAAACVQNILLTAHGMGLGACWVGAFDEEAVAGSIGLPDYYRIQAIVPIGVPDETPPPPPRYQLEVMLSLNRWGDNSAKTFDPYTEVLKDWSPHVMNAVGKAQEIAKTGTQRFGEALSNGFKNLGKKIKK